MKKLKPLSWFLFLAVITCMVACKLTTAETSVLTGDYETPKLLLFQPLDESSIELLFSKEITVQDVNVDQVEDIDENGDIRREIIDSLDLETEVIDGTLLRIYLKTKTKLGKKYSVQGKVLDKNGNSLDFLGYITGYNNRIPKIVINELRTEYTKPKVEFIEFLVLSDGNLAGINVFNSYDGEKARYEFPFVEVKSGEYIVLHLRKIEEGCVDELERLDESKGTEALPTARDFWADNITARLGKTDVILLEERKNGNILDAVLLCESKYSTWPKEIHEMAAKRAFDSGFWANGWQPENAICSDYTTTTRTFSRQNVTEKNSKASWIIVDSSQASPGKENSTKAYIPKL